VGGGYVDSELLVNSHSDYQVDLVGPIKEDIHWQTKDESAYSIDTFEIDWEGRTVTCPQGQTTKYWKPTKDANGNDIIVIRFSRPGCWSCKSRSRCTRAKKESRSLTLRPQTQHDAIQKSRKEQKRPQWKERYNKRAGIEGTISQGVRGFGLRQARYIGLAKTHLQNILTGAAINIARIDDWFTGTPLAKTRTSRFKAMEAKVA
jgi:transposase